MRSKLLLFSLGLVVVPGIVAAIVALASASRALERAVGRQLATIANGAAHDLERALEERREAMRVWARQAVMREIIVDDVDKRIAQFLTSVRAEGAPDVEFLCTDAAGRVVAATVPEALGTVQQEQAWYKAARRGIEFFSGPEPAGEGGRPVLTRAVPIHDPERTDVVIGTLVARSDWQATMHLFDEIRRDTDTLGLHVDLVVLGHDDVVLGGSWGPGVAPRPGRRLRDAGWRTVAATVAHGPRGFAAEPGADALVGHARLSDGLAWTVLVIQPKTDALAPVQAMRHRLLLLLGIVLCGTVVVALLLAARMIRPLRALIAATREIGQTGSGAVAVAVRRGDEIGELAEAFNAMAAALESAQADLVSAAKLALVGEMAAGIAHEVRTPLGIVRGSAQMLGRGLPPGETRQQELVGLIIGEVDRLDGVVTALTELARPRPPVREPTDLGSVLARVLDFVAGQAAERGVTLLRDFTRTPCVAECDADQIYQVALNLVMNGLQILERGGTVTVRTCPAAGGLVGFDVEDDGPGIPAHIRDQVFTPFVTARPGGTGLGLALVERVVRAHGGTVTVDSEIGQGARFRVRLPVPEEDR